jgi:hypothetical protein
VTIAASAIAAASAISTDVVAVIIALTYMVCAGLTWVLMMNRSIPTFLGGVEGGVEGRSGDVDASV